MTSTDSARPVCQACAAQASCRTAIDPTRRRAAPVGGCSRQRRDDPSRPTVVEWAQHDIAGGLRHDPRGTGQAKPRHRSERFSTAVFACPPGGATARQPATRRRLVPAAVPSLTKGDLRTLSALAVAAIAAARAAALVGRLARPAGGPAWRAAEGLEHRTPSPAWMHVSWTHVGSGGCRRSSSLSNAYRLGNGEDLRLLRSPSDSSIRPGNLPTGTDLEGCVTPRGPTCVRSDRRGCASPAQ